MLSRLVILLGVGWLALLILDTGAMRRPEDGDRRGETNSHVFFVSRFKLNINAELGETGCM